MASMPEQSTDARMISSATSSPLALTCLPLCRHHARGSVEHSTAAAHGRRSTSPEIQPPQPDPRKPFRRHRELYPFASHWCDAAGRRLHYLDEGPALVGRSERDGQSSTGAPSTLVLLHGNPTWSFLYRRLILRLRAHCRCIAPDLPGFGLSPTPPRPLRPAAHAESIAALLDALGLDDYVLVAHDWGGPIGLAAARQRPRALRGLVLANSFAWPLRGASSWRLRLFSVLAGGPPAVFASRCCNAFLELGLRVAIRRRPLPAAVLDGYRAPFRERERRSAMHGLARELLGSTGFLAAVEQDLARFRDRPVLLCWGGRDPFVGTYERRRFEAAFPEHQSLLLPEAGHFVPEDTPAAMAEAMLAWPGCRWR